MNLLVKLNCPELFCSFKLALKLPLVWKISSNCSSTSSKTGRIPAAKASFWTFFVKTFVVQSLSVRWRHLWFHELHNQNKVDFCEKTQNGRRKLLKSATKTSQFSLTLVLESDLTSSETIQTFHCWFVNVIAILKHRKEFAKSFFFVFPSSFSRTQFVWRKKNP